MRENVKRFISLAQQQNRNIMTTHCLSA